MKAVVAAFNQEKALVGAYSVITNLRMELFQALFCTEQIFAPARPGSVPANQGHCLDNYPDILYKKHHFLEDLYSPDI